MYALLTDGMEIKEGDEVRFNNEWYSAFDMVNHGYLKNIYLSPIRRKLSTEDEVRVFCKESKECEE